MKPFMTVFCDLYRLKKRCLVNGSFEHTSRNLTKNSTSTEIAIMQNTEKCLSCCNRHEVLLDNPLDVARVKPAVELLHNYQASKQSMQID